LQPGEYIKSDDIFDFQVVKHAPALRAAMQELVLATGGSVNGNLDYAQLGPSAPAALTPLARLCFHLLKVTNSQHGITIAGGLQRAFTHLFADVGHSFVVGRASLDKALGPVGGALLWDALMEVIPAQRGLQAVLHRAQLPLEPTADDVPLTREEAEVLLAQSPETLRAMVEAAPIPQALPALTAAAQQVKADAFKDVHVVAVQHVLSTNRTMFAAMESHGLDPKKTEIVGIPYSTNYVVEHAFRESGYAIHTPLVVDPNDITRAYEVAVEAAVDRAVARALTDGKPILLVDDGGKATVVAAKKYPHLAHLFRAVEQTTRGLTEIANVEATLGHPLPFPVVDVAKSPLKAHEMPKIGAQVVGEIEKITRQIGGLDLAGKDVLVTGFGPIGRGVALALAARGARVTIWDPSPDAQARARDDGFVAAATRESALANKALIVGASGHRSVGRDDLKLLAKNCVLCSASSRDVEIDLSVNRDADIESVPLLTAGRGDRRFVTRVWRLADKDIVVLKNGFPLNFNGDYETGTAADIEQTRALMFMAAAQAVGGLMAPDLPPSTSTSLGRCSPSVRSGL
jgi:S-adenosylhomocysteine hydrolase